MAASEDRDGVGQDAMDAAEAVASFQSMIADVAAAAGKVRQRASADNKMPLHLLQVAKAKARACLEIGCALQSDGVLDAGADVFIERLRAFIDTTERFMVRAGLFREAATAVEALRVRFEWMRTQMDEVIAEAESAAQPTVYHGITVRCDGNSVVTSVRIDDQALAEYTHAGLSRAVTQAMQTCHDQMNTTMLTKLSTVDGDEPDRGDQPPISGAEFVETYGSGQLSVAVDIRARPVMCQITPEAAAWDLSVLGERITWLCRLAQLTAQFDLFQSYNQAGKYGHIGPVEADIDACRTALT
ncbi:Uncharacterised protein [Mycobacteroides abscessus subsp. abscessus]|uniref:hypothetical protein n=1 Tax=Mycobacteroides abscessus TaxID=36809 RepID=UPI00092C678B|nr:hypothetical protein [Mycobacteroides abscessus]SHU69378.1 Uncharacterised protein [Mycobacteroides abscessus subsp. abscessus]